MKVYVPLEYSIDLDPEDVPQFLEDVREMARLFGLQREPNSSVKLLALVKTFPGGAV